MSKGKRYEEPKLNMKKVFAVIIAVIVLIMCVVMLQGILSKDDKQGKVVSKDYFAAYDNNKWGIIDSNGDTVIPPSYAEMIIVPNSKSDVFLCTYDVDYTNNTYKTKVLNSKNEEIFLNFEKVEAIASTDENSNLYYDTSALKVQKTGKYGLIDFSGKELLPCEYDNIVALNGIQGIFKIVKDGKCGIANSEGKIYIPAQYEDVTNLGKEKSKGFVVKEAGKYGVVDSNNKVLLEIKYDGIEKIEAESYYVVLQGAKQVVVKNDGTEVLNGNYDKIVSILKNAENGVIYQKANKCGVMKLDGTVVLKPEYENLKEGKSGNIIAKQNGKYGIIDLQGNTKLDFKYQTLAYNEKANMYIAEDEQYNNVILDDKLQVKQEGYLIELNETKGYIELRQNDEYKYYNFKFEEQKPSSIFTNNTLFVSKNNGKYGFVDKDGKVVVDYIYDDVTNQNMYGYAGVKKDGKWGAVNKDGSLIQVPTYELEDYLKVDFIGGWHLGKDLNMNYYKK